MNTTQSLFNGWNAFAGFAEKVAAAGNIPGPGNMFSPQLVPHMYRAARADKIKLANAQRLEEARQRQARIAANQQLAARQRQSDRTLRQLMGAVVALGRR